MPQFCEPATRRRCSGRACITRLHRGCRRSLRSCRRCLRPASNPAPHAAAPCTQSSHGVAAHRARGPMGPGQTLQQGVAGAAGLGNPVALRVSVLQKQVTQAGEGAHVHMLAEPSNAAWQPVGHPDCRCAAASLIPADCPPFCCRCPLPAGWMWRPTRRMRLAGAWSRAISDTSTHYSATWARRVGACCSSSSSVLICHNPLSGAASEGKGSCGSHAHAAVQFPPPCRHAHVPCMSAAAAAGHTMCAA